MTKKSFMSALLIILLAGLSASCDKEPEIDELLIGSWRVTRANIHWVQSFRHNKSWAEQERVEGKFSRIVENKEKVEGNWAVEYSKADKKTYIVITPTVPGDGKGIWVKDQPARFEVLDLTREQMVLGNEQGQIVTWARVRSKQSDDGEIDMDIAVVNPGPIIVNLQMDRSHGKFRFLCLDLTLSIEDAEGLDYLVVEKNPDSQVATYHLHPVIKDVAITFLSNQTYADTKSLDKVKNVINEFKMVLSPYFEGRLTDITVNKVVVTAEPDSVAEFEKLYIEQYGGTGSAGDAKAQ